jgi:hypothetical protein
MCSRPGTAGHQPTFAQIDPSGVIWPHVWPPRDATRRPFDQIFTPT